MRQIRLMHYRPRKVLRIRLSRPPMKCLWKALFAFVLICSACQSRSTDKPQSSSQQLLQEGEQALQRKNMARARELLERSIKSNPTDPSLPYRAGQILAGHQHYSEAIGLLEKALALALDEHLAERLEGRNLLIKIYWELAQTHFAVGKFDKAVEFLDQFKPATGDQQGEAAYYNLRGTSRVMLGHLVEGRNDLERAIQLDSMQASYYGDLILASLKVQETSRAQELAKQAREKFPQDAKLQVIAAQALYRKPRTLPVWSLKGEGVVCCPCTVPCPCRSNGPPSGSHCESLGVMRIASGYCGKIALAGSRFAVPGCMSDPFRFVPTLYVHEDISVQAEEGIKQIFRSFNPDNPVVFPSVRRVPISFHRDGLVLEAASPDLFRIRVRLRLDSKGNPLMHTAALDYFSNVLAYAENLTYWFRDPSLGPEANWDFSGRQANYRSIDVSSSHYRQGQMLIQWGDKSGSFNDRQLELIRRQNLPLLPSYSP